MRRRVLAALGLAVVLAAAQRTDLVGQAAGDRMPVFEVDTTFPRLPNNWVMGHVPGIAVDARDHVYILHRPRTVPEAQRQLAAPPVLEFDASGKFVKGWGGPGDGFDWPDSEHGITVDYKGNVWIGGSSPTSQSLTKRSDDMLLKFTNDGKFLLQIGGRDSSGGNKDTRNVKKSADVYVHPATNEAFVADGYGNRRIIVFDADTGAFKRMWGAFGNVPEDAPEPSPANYIGNQPNPAPAPARSLDTEGPGAQQFSSPVHGVKVSKDGLVYAADRPNRRVQVFTPDGKYVNQVFINRGGPSTNSAAGVAFSPDPEQQFLYVADYGNSRIVVVDRKALRVLYQFGERSAAPGNFQGPHHLAVDSKGNLYTAEVSPGNRAQRFAFKGLSTTLPPNALRQAPPQQTRGPAPFPGVNAMSNPFQMVRNWPTLGTIKPGAAIGIIPDGKGGTWLHHRSEPAIIHFDASGKIIKSFAEGVFTQAHGFCQDRDGNFWAGDSGPFNDNPSVAGRGFVMHKFSPDGKLLMTLGKPGVSRAGTDTFIGPTACAIAENGDIIIADGHWPRPSTAQQDGDRIVRYTKDGKFVGQWGRMGTAPGEFMGPHALAFDSQWRLFVADRSNNRVQVFDKNMKFIDEWRHFGRPSGITILKDDTLIVSDSESGYPIGGPSIAPEGGGNSLRNPGWRNGIRIGSAKDGSLRAFIDGTRPEGLAGDELGNIFAGLTGGCDASPSGGCLQKWVRRSGSGATN